MTGRAYETHEDAVDALVTEDVLKALRAKTRFIPPSLHVASRGRELQFFEVLSAYLMSLIESEFEWTVTPLQGDGGVDFQGERHLFPLRGYEDFKVVIAGQCKAGQSLRKPLTSDLFGLLAAARPSVVYLFLMKRFRPKEIEAAQQHFQTQTQRLCRIVDLDGMLDLFDMRRRDVLDFIDHALLAPEANLLRGFIERLPTTRDIAIDVRADGPERVQAGSPFAIRVSVSSLYFSGKPVHMRHEPLPTLTVIKPIAMETGDGFRLEASECLATTLLLKCVTYQVGTVPLGELFFEVDGRVVKRVDLGSVTAADQYHPAFFWEPYECQRLSYLGIAAQAESHAPQGIAVTGQGGSGKTRFCQELGYLAEQHGGEFVSIAHPQHRGQPYRILGFLTQELLGGSIDPVDPRASVERYIENIHPTLFESARGTLATIYSSGGDGEQLFDREAMLQVLVAIVLRKSRSTLHVIHLSDLHWASSEVLDVLGTLLQRFQKIASEYGVKLLMVFEGRVQTNVESRPAAPDAQRGSSAIFESFIKRSALTRLEIRPFTREESRGFLAHLFENTQSPSRRVLRALIPHQVRLVAEIERYGRGNPFHMIEQIKLLRQHDVVQRNPRTGLVYLAARPARKYAVPENVHELIALRLQFIESVSPNVATLIKAVGLIKDGVDHSLFETLRYDLAEDASLSAIQSVELLNHDDELHSVRFRHENYYEVVRGWPLTASERARITDVYLRWYRRAPHKTADRYYEEALVRMQRPRVDRRRIGALLKEALDRAERAHQYQLAIQVAEELLKQNASEDIIGGGFAALIESLTLRSKLAHFSIEVEDWALGAEQYQRILNFLDEYERVVVRIPLEIRTTIHYWRASSLVGLANSMTDLSRSHEALQNLQEARALCESYFASTSKRTIDAKWPALYGRLLNRLGEANWMDGNYVESIRHLEAATAAIDRYVRSRADLRHMHHINLLDYGAVLLHTAPRKGVAQMRASIALIPKTGWSPHYAILASITLVLGEIVERFLREKGCSGRFGAFLRQDAIPRLQRDYERASFHGLKQEEVAASLILGVCLSLLNDSSAVQWYMECIETAFRSNNIESLWRAHLNLGQFLLREGDEESSAFHCARAASLLLTDLRPRRPEERVWRQRHLARPLRRLLSLLDASQADELRLYVDSSAAVNRRPVDSTFFNDQIIFLWSGEDEYYPYGG